MRSVTIVKIASASRRAARKTDFGGGNSPGHTETDAIDLRRFSEDSSIERVTKTLRWAREWDGIESPLVQIVVRLCYTRQL